MTRPLRKARTARLRGAERGAGVPASDEPGFGAEPRLIRPVWPACNANATARFQTDSVIRGTIFRHSQRNGAETIERRPGRHRRKSRETVREWPWRELCV